MNENAQSEWIKKQEEDRAATAKLDGINLLTAQIFVMWNPSAGKHDMLAIFLFNCINEKAKKKEITIGNRWIDREAIFTELFVRQT